MNITIPFVFGVKAEGDNFTDRREETHDGEDFEFDIKKDTYEKVFLLSINRCINFYFYQL